MKQLILLRHAKTESSSASGEDHTRKLTKRGHFDAAEVGKFLTSNIPDHILCSTATRTRETTECLLEIWKTPLEVTYLDKLYLASPDDILSAIHKTPPTTQKLLVVGHNPGIHQLAFDLAGDDQSKQLQRLSIAFPTSAFAHFSVNAKDWNGMDENCTTLEDFRDRHSLG